MRTLGVLIEPKPSQKNIALLEFSIQICVQRAQSNKNNYLLQWMDSLSHALSSTYMDKDPAATYPLIMDDLNVCFVHIRNIFMNRYL